jgi:hypothetical protein
VSLAEYLRWTTDWRKKNFPRKDPYVCFEDFVVQNGTERGPNPLTDDEWAYFRSCAGNSRFAIKQCYYNSQLLILRDDREGRLTYVEGYAQGVIPVLHGWVEINGKVVDVTMRLREPMRRPKRKAFRDRAIGDWKDEGRAYVGVPFTKEFIAKRVVDSGVVSGVIDDMPSGFPSIRGDLDRHIVGRKAA